MRPVIVKTVNTAPVKPTQAMLHEMACAFVEDEYRQKGQCRFVWIIATGFNVAYVETPWTDDTEKQIAVHLMRGMINMMACDAYAHCVEAWIASIPPDHPDQKYWIEFSEKHGVSKMPPTMRDDVAIVMTFARDTDTCMSSRYIVYQRRKQGKGPDFLGPRQDEHDMRMSGRMANLFLDPQAMRDMEARFLKEAMGQGTSPRKEQNRGNSSSD